jgi:PAS domain S-box-containing protein
MRAPSYAMTDTREIRPMLNVGMIVPAFDVPIAAILEMAKQTPLAVLVTDSEGTIHFVNAAFTTQTGFRGDEVIGKTPRILKSGEHPPEFYTQLWHTIEIGGVWRGTIKNRSKNGQVFTDEAVIFPIKNESGTITHYASFTERATRDTEFESQMRQSQKLEAIGQLAAGIAHEINTPTQYIGDNIQFFQESIGGIFDLLHRYDELLEAARNDTAHAELVHAIDQVKDAVDLAFLLEETPGAIERTIEGNRRVAEVVRAMKEFAHPSAEDITPTDINRAINNTISVCRNEWKYVAEMETHLDPDLPLVPCLPGAFNQVVLNIIVNAAHAVQESVGDSATQKGTITVSTAIVDDYAEIRIADTGSGIPDEVRHKVYNPFFTTKALGKGTGQGLAIARSVIVETHGGTIDFESNEGHGTVFVIRLPLTPHSRE